MRTAACNAGTSSENAARCVTFSSNANTDRRSPERNTWRMKCAAASFSKPISMFALRLESIISAKSSGSLVSDSNTSIFCRTPSSKTWKASIGKSGAGRLCSSSTLANMLTRSTFTLILPRCASVSSGGLSGCSGVATMLPGGGGAGSDGGVGAEAPPEEELAGSLGFGCAHGGRSGLS